ncbi:MAG: CpsD/CapB family tyrosine-protein kinase [Caulobacteraceae bacterium]
MSQTVLTRPDIATPPPASGGPAGEDDYVLSPSLITISRPQDTAAESIRALRTHIMAQHVSLGRRALAVCGASPGVGCSFIAANLAVALSQIGIKTLLIDGDLRRPSIEGLIRPPRRGPGLAECLLSPDGNFSDSIEPDVLADLSVMYAGESAGNPQELLAGDRFKSLMDFCLREFDATIVDTPPANSCSDARRISTVVGYSLIVTGRNKSFIDDLKTLDHQLQADHARVIGTVLNQA